MSTSVKSVDVCTAQDWLVAGQAVLIDVREPGEYQATRIPGAVLLPMGRVSQKTLPESQGKKLILYCQSGLRSARAGQHLLKENPQLDVYNLEGGIVAWRKSGQPIEGTGGFFLPLDRQVQLTIGVSVFSSSLLGFYAHPGFLLVSGFFGLGLMFAGLTGICGLAMLMAKMPWNQKGGEATKSTCCSG